MSNSPLVQVTRISPNRTSPRLRAIDTITIHCVIGQLTASQIVNLNNFTRYDPTNGSSCNYAVGRDGSIGLCVDEGDRSWCSSSKSNDHRAITIEVASDTKHPYAVTPEAYNALIDLLVDICQRNGIDGLRWQGDKSLVGQVDKQNMTVHRWFANKSCPGDYLYNRHGEIAAAVNARLGTNSTKIEEDDVMYLEKFAQLMSEYRSNLRDNDASAYSKEAREWAVSTGLIAGGGTTESGEPNYMWEDLLTREQLVTVLYRFAQMMDRA